MQYEKVFNDYHDLIFSLTRQNCFKGLRVDHIDGLYEPAGYLKRLKEKAGEKTFIVVEKILAMDEKLPADWKIEGTTGYDFLTWINNLFTNGKKLSVLKSYYEELTGQTLDIELEQTRKKALILYEYMGGELENLLRLVPGLIRIDQLTNCSLAELRTAIGEFLVHLPVYRLYAEKLPLTGKDANIIEEVFGKIINNGRATESAIDILRQLFLTSQPGEDSASHALHFFKRCMQFTGPLMAKGVEDTLMYSCAYFIGHNEVGDSPANNGISKEAFHQAMIDRQQKFPLALNATSTHDTKRGEDARARMNVITEFADEWIAKVKKWRKICEPFKENNIPDANEEYFIYQTLIAVYPCLGSTKDFEQRIHTYLEKALREAKINSNWVGPNLDYENKVKQFATALLNTESDFGKIFFPFQKKIAEWGAINSLAQVVLKFTCPGIPDIYQGCELWDLSLVDPDNRRVVDFKKRMTLLDEINEDENDVGFLSRLWQDRADGKIKLWLTKKLLQLRGKSPGFFAKAEYLPLAINGIFADHVFAFARRWQKKWLIVSIPLQVACLSNSQKVDDFFSIDWDNTAVEFPVKGRANDQLQGRCFEVSLGYPVRTLFDVLPVSVVMIDADN
jgi:malto-oligosyltrehalose synthase